MRLKWAAAVTMLCENVNEPYDFYNSGGGGVGTVKFQSQRNTYPLVSPPPPEKKKKKNKKKFTKWWRKFAVILVMGEWNPGLTKQVKRREENWYSWQKIQSNLFSGHMYVCHYVSKEDDATDSFRAFVPFE